MFGFESSEAHTPNIRFSMEHFRDEIVLHKNYSLLNQNIEKKRTVTDDVSFEMLKSQSGRNAFPKEAIKNEQNVHHKNKNVN